MCAEKCVPPAIFGCLAFTSSNNCGLSDELYGDYSIPPPRKFDKLPYLKGNSFFQTIFFVVSIR